MSNFASALLYARGENRSATFAELDSDTREHLIACWTAEQSLGDLLDPVSDTGCAEIVKLMSRAVSSPLGRGTADAHAALGAELLGRVTAHAEDIVGRLFDATTIIPAWAA